jgi:hypothetical protein
MPPGIEMGMSLSFSSFRSVAGLLRRVQAVCVWQGHIAFDGFLLRIHCVWQPARLSFWGARRREEHRVNCPSSFEKRSGPRRLQEFTSTPKSTASRNVEPLPRNASRVLQVDSELRFRGRYQILTVENSAASIVTSSNYTVELQANRACELRVEYVHKLD